MGTTKPKFTVIVDEELNQLIEDYQFNNRMKSKSAAAVELIRKGLTEDKQKEPLQQIYIREDRQDKQ